jgi:hypothetical protein
VKKESSEAIRNQYVSENEYLKSSINRASLGRSSTVKSGMQSPRSSGRMEGTGVVTDFIRNFENVGNGSSGDDDDSDSENSDSDRDDDNSDDNDDSVSEELEVDGDNSDDSESEEIVKNIEKKIKNIFKNKNIVHVEDSEEDQVEVEVEDSDTLDSVKYNSRGTYKSILEEFEDMENENSNDNRNEISYENKLEDSETDVEVEVDSSSIIKVFSKGGFEYNEKEIGVKDDVIDDGIDEESDDEEMSMDMEIKYKEIDNSKELRSKSDETESNSNSDSNFEDSDGYLVLHQSNVDDVLKNLLNDFEINITSEKSKKKTVKNITKKGIKNTKKKKISLLKNANLKSEIHSLHLSKSEKKNKKDKKVKSSSEKNKKTSRSLTLLELQNEKNGFVINLFQNILSHKNTIFCFTLAVTMHYFIFSGILKLV